MIKVILRLDCGIGMNSADAYLVSQEDWDIYQSLKYVATDQLAIYSWESAVEFASSYGIYPISEQSDAYNEDEEQDGWLSDEYSEDINGWFELYNPKKHDGLIVGMGDWDWKEI